MLSSIITAAWGRGLPSITRAPGCCDHGWQTSPLRSAFSLQSRPDPRHLLGENAFLVTLKSRPIGRESSLKQWWVALSLGPCLSDEKRPFPVETGQNLLWSIVREPCLSSSRKLYPDHVSRAKDEQTQVQDLVLLLIICVIPHKWLHLPEPQFPPQKNWDKKPTPRIMPVGRSYNCRITKELYSPPFFSPFLWNSMALRVLVIRFSSQSHSLLMNNFYPNAVFIGNPRCANRLQPSSVGLPSASSVQTDPGR